MTARHGVGRRPAREILARVALVLWITICGLAVLLWGIAGMVAVLDPAVPDRGAQELGSLILVLAALLLGYPAAWLLRGAARRRPLLRGRAVVHGEPPMPYRQASSRHLLAQYRRMSAADNTTGPALARLAAAERALGDALYRLDLRRAELGVPRDVVVGARTVALDAAAALRRWTQDAPLTTTRYDVARPIDGGALAIKRLTSTVESVLAGEGTVDEVRAATGEVAEPAG